MLSRCCGGSLVISKTCNRRLAASQTQISRSSGVRPMPWLGQPDASVYPARSRPPRPAPTSPPFVSSPISNPSSPLTLTKQRVFEALTVKGRTGALNGPTCLKTSPFGPFCATLRTGLASWPDTPRCRRGCKWCCGALLPVSILCKTFPVAHRRRSNAALRRMAQTAAARRARSTSDRNRPAAFFPTRAVRSADPSNTASWAS